MNRRRNQIIAGVVLLLIIVAWVASGGNGNDGPLIDTKPVARPVPVAQVQPLPNVLTREFPAKVRASQRVQLAFSVPGQLVELNAQEGRIVRKGEVIARLDPRDYQNALDVAKANLVDAEQDFERTKRLLKQKVVADSEFERKEAAFKSTAAEARIREKALKDTVLQAPFDGVIASRTVENHEHIQAKQTIVSVQDISSIEVVLQIPEGLVAHGGSDCLRKISVRLDADGGRWFDAEVREFNVQADSVTRSYDLVLGMKPPQDIKVLPGMTATVRAEVEREEPVEGWNENLTVVPAGALFSGSDGASFVWVIGEGEGYPVRVKVEPGKPRDSGIEIRSGLKAGQRIATAGVHSLDEETLVRPMRAGGEGLDG